MGYAVVDSGGEVHAIIKDDGGGQVTWEYKEEDGPLQSLVETALIEGLEVGRKNYLPGEGKFDELFWAKLGDEGYTLTFLPDGDVEVETVERSGVEEEDLMPKALVDKLPAKAKEIYEAAYEAAIKEYEGDEERAAKVAIAAVKRAGYKKDEKTGRWMKMEVVRAYFTKAELNQAGQMAWKATVSKFDQDEQGDIVYEDFYKSAIAAFESGERPAPVVCISHIDKGKATDDWAAGTTEAMYIDGKMPKARGVFADTPLGKALFEAVKADIDNGVPHEDRIRISMGFFATEVEPLEAGRGFKRGWIKHFAATRVPVVKETQIMTEKGTIETRAQDAASIVGDALAATLLGGDETPPEQKGLVTKANQDQVRELLDKLNALLADMDTNEGTAPDASGARRPLGNEGSNLTEPVPASGEAVAASTAAADPVDSLVDAFGVSVKAALRSEGSRVDKFKTVQEALNAFGEQVTGLVNASTAPSTDDITAAVTAAVAPLQQQIVALKAQLDGMQQTPVVAAPASPTSMDQRVALPMAPFPVSGAGAVQGNEALQTKSLADLAWASTDPRLG